MEDDEDFNQDNENFLDEKEFKAKFMLTPDIKEEFSGQFSHMDKNLAITNLRFERNGMNEPDELRIIGRALHILNNSVHFEEIEKEVFLKLERVAYQGRVIEVPVYRKVRVLKSKYPKTFHSLRTEFMTFVNTSASRQGHRIKAAISNVRVKEESYEEKTDVPSRWPPMKKPPR